MTTRTMRPGAAACTAAVSLLAFASVAPAQAPPQVHELRIAVSAMPEASPLAGASVRISGTGIVSVEGIAGATAAQLASGLALGSASEVTVFLRAGVYPVQVSHPSRGSLARDLTVPPAGAKDAQHLELACGLGSPAEKAQSYYGRPLPIGASTFRVVEWQPGGAVRTIAGKAPAGARVPAQSAATPADPAVQAAPAAATGRPSSLLPSDRATASSGSSASAAGPAGSVPTGTRDTSGPWSRAAGDDPAVVLAGEWEAKDPTGRYSSATWRLTAVGNGRYRLEQVGLAELSGTASLDGNRLLVQFTTTTGYVGLGEFELDGARHAAKGRIRLTANNAPYGDFAYDLARASRPPVVSTAASPAGTAPGVWDWNWRLNTGTLGNSRVMLHPDGTAVCADVPPGFGPIGSWWEEAGNVLVYWGGPFPKTNRHYVMTFTPAGDGRRMASTVANYYTSAIDAERVTGMPPAGVADFSGVWDAIDTGYPVQVAITQVGDRVSGAYVGLGGKLDCTVAGQTLRCRWTLGARAGEGEMVLSADGTSYSGGWTAPGEPGGKWTATRKSGGGGSVARSAGPTN